MRNKLERQSLNIINSNTDKILLEKQELEVANQKLEEFVATVTHDLQAPLRSLTMFAELLTQEYQGCLDEVGNKYIQHISDSGVRMQALIQDLLLYARAGTSEKTWVSVDLNIVLDSVTQDLQAAIAEANAIIIVEDLPTILVNPVEITQVLQNLVDNGLKFSRKQPRIEIKAEKQTENWLISVKDNGIGIEPEFQEQIFQVLQRLHPPDVYPGTGIGLAICQKILQRYESNIWVESEIGKGSTFYFTFPVNNAPNPLI